MNWDLNIKKKLVRHRRERQSQSLKHKGCLNTEKLVGVWAHNNIVGIREQIGQGY